jgi:hypothetical protein
MSETQFAMISDWMENGNINEFVKAHPGANRLELVGISFMVSLLRFAFIGDRMTFLAGRRCSGINLHSQPGNDSRGP